MKKVLITRKLPEAVMARAREEFEVVAREKDAPMALAEAIEALRDYDAVVPTLGDAFSAETFAAVKSPRCKLLANFGVGYNHIDVAAARAAGVAVTNTPGAVTEATADIGLMLILMAARRASEGEALVRSRRWSGWAPSAAVRSSLWRFSSAPAKPEAAMPSICATAPISRSPA